MEQINEATARAAKDANSFSDYIEGSATANYNAKCAEAREAAGERKKEVPEERHAELDRLVERYCTKLASWTNRNNANEASCPSVMISGAGNFPVKKKEKQNARRDSLMREYNEIAAILEKIKSYGVGGFPILAGDADAIEKLKAKIASAEEAQEAMKLHNAYYRKHKTLKGCEGISDKLAEQLDAVIPTTLEKVPHAGWELSNNNANIKRMKERLATLEREKNTEATEWVTDGLNLTVVENKEIMRLQVIFEDKPSAAVRELLKGAAFHWSPSQNAWQRQLTDNARYTLKNILKKLKENA